MTCVNISMRFTIFVMICLNAINMNIVRGNMSIVILAMVKPLSKTTAEVPDYGPRYEWSAYEQSLVIGSFFWGQLVVTFFAGVLAERYGARRITGCTLIVAMVLSLLAPISANVLWLLITLHFLTGISMGAIPPGNQYLISNWAPPQEKAKFLSATMANGFGIVITWTMSGFIIRNLGWQYVFYTVGTILGIYAIAWWFIVYDSPKIHPSITVTEKEFILSNLNKTSTRSKPWPPFQSILLSVPFWALVFYHFGNLYNSYFCTTAIPKYLSEVHKNILNYFFPPMAYIVLFHIRTRIWTVHRLNISTIGVLSSIPYLIRFPFSIIFGFVSDFLCKRKLLPPTVIRKGFSIFSHLIPACCLIGLAFLGNKPYVCVALLTIALGSGSSVTVSSLQNPYDLSPNFSTTIFAFMHTIGSSAGFISPMVVAYFTKNRNTEDEWRYIFFINAGILLCTAIIFITFGSGKIQKWNKIEDEVYREKEVQPFVEYPKIEK